MGSTLGRPHRVLLISMVGVGGGGNRPIRLSLESVGSDAVSRERMTKLSCTLRHTAGVRALVLCMKENLHALELMTRALEV